MVLYADSPADLEQLDARYFQGLEGRYRFELSFRVHKEGETDYITRSHGNYWMRRSVTAELELEPGEYSVLVRIVATKNDGPSVEQMVRDNARERPDKLMRIGLAYDLAHAKGQMKETSEEKKDRKAKEEEAKKKEKKEMKEKLMREKKARKHTDNREKKRARADRDKKKLKEKAKAAKRAEKKKARKEKAEKEEKEREQADKESKEAPKPEESKAAEVENNTTTSAESPAITETKSEEPASTEAKLTESATEQAAATPGSTEEAKTDASTTPAAEEKKPEVEQAKPAEPITELTSEKKDDKVPAALDAPSSEEKTTTFPDPSAAVPDIVEGGEEADSDSDSDLDSICSDISSVAISEYVAEAKAAAEAARVEPPEEELDEFEQDPWNAIAVVGLRVYSKDATVAVKVVRPRDRAKEEKNTPAEGKLDVDDSAADALKSGEGEAAKSESGNSQKTEDSSVIVV